MENKYKAPMSSNRKPLHTLLPLDAPLSLFIDPSDICNFKCEFCFQHHINYSGQIMDKSLFEKIINDMKEFDSPFKMVHLNGFGEPLINPAIFDFIRILKEENVAEIVSITTNASLLDKEKAEKLISAGLDKIHISIYALEDEGYFKFSNAKVSFNNIYENIKYLYSIKSKCHIHIKIAGDYFSDQEKKHFLNLFESISDTMFIDSAINAWPGLKVVDDTQNHMYGMGNENRICPMPFYQLVIHSNGKISPCCNEYQQKLIVGDIYKDSLKEIWNGEKINKLRRNILKNTIPQKCVCNYCEYPKCGATVDITPYRDMLLPFYEEEIK